MTSRTIDIVHITDCHDTGAVGGELAAIKVKRRYADRADHHDIATRLIEVAPAEEFNTIDVGAKFSELATSAVNPNRLVLAINAAPPSIPGGTGNNERRNFVLGRLKNGVVFGGTWGGHCLSYVKSEIAELYELLDSNNGSQFRSLEVLPDALLDFKADKIDTARLRLVDVAKEVPNVPRHSHAWTIDNFGNVKLFLNDDDKVRLRSLFEAKAKGTDGRRVAPVKFAFGDRSVEFAPAANAQFEPASSQFAAAALAQKLFCIEIGTNVVSLTSSAKRWNTRGQFTDVEQIATLRGEPHKPLGYTLPKIGAPVFFGA
ncbi:MAG: hypothetical protein KGQ41_07260 [Alphaproteobacteria bacterium]|nr:hypothetical protein [Alphaproteobacteria bacterium]